MSPTAFMVCGYFLNMESSERLAKLRSVGSGVSWGPEKGSSGKQRGSHTWQECFETEYPISLGKPQSWEASSPRKHMSLNSELQISGSLG